jgi:hypothetical protein
MGEITQAFKDGFFGAFVGALAILVKACPYLLGAAVAGLFWLLIAKTDDACIVVRQEQRLVPQADGSYLLETTFRCPDGRVIESQ